MNTTHTSTTMTTTPALTASEIASDKTLAAFELRQQQLRLPLPDTLVEAAEAITAFIRPEDGLEVQETGNCLWIWVAGTENYKGSRTPLWSINDIAGRHNWELLVNVLYAYRVGKAVG